MSLNQCNDSRKVEVIPHNPTWRITFIEDSKQIALAMGESEIYSDRPHNLLNSQSILLDYLKVIS